MITSKITNGISYRIQLQVHMLYPNCSLSIPSAY